MMRHIWLGVLALCSLGLAEPRSALAQGFYDGKVLEVIVPFEPGGGTDTWGRTLAPFLQKELGEGVGIQILNRPGGSGINGSNEFFLKSPHDGSTIYMSSGSTVLPWLLRLKAVMYDHDKMMPVIGQAVGNVVYTRSSYGDVVELLKNPPEDLVSAGIAATGADLAVILAFKLLDIKVQHVMGYAGGGPVRLAFEQGEVNIGHTSAPAYKSNVQPLVDNGEVQPMFTLGIIDASGNLIRDPEFPEIPTVKEIYEKLHGKEPSGTIWDAYKAVTVAGWGLQKVIWYHDDAPAEAREALVAAFRKTLQNPEFQTISRERIGNYPYLIGDEVSVAFKSSTAIDQATYDWIIDLLRTEYDIQF